MSFIAIFALGLFSTALIIPTMMWVMKATAMGVPRDLIALLMIVASVVTILNIATGLAAGLGFEALSWLGWPLGVFIAATSLRKFYEHTLKQ